MPEQPTIQDILGFQRDWDKETRYDVTGDLPTYDLRYPNLPPEHAANQPDYVGAGDAYMGKTRTGQSSMADYLSDLINKSGAYGKSITGTGAGGLRTAVGTDLDMGKAMSDLYTKEDFTGMSRSDLEDFFTQTYGEEIGALKGEGEYASDYGIERGQGWFSDDPHYGFEAQNVEELYGMSEEERNKALYGQYGTFYEGLIDPESEFYSEEAESRYSASGRTEKLSEEDFISSLTGGIDFTPRYEKMQEGTGFEEGDLEALLDYSQAMQEGLGRVGSITEGFDLSGQLAGEERDVEREAKTALQSYMPREITSRYGALQGGGDETGEMAEAEYLRTLSAADRRKGRNVRSIYGELEDKMFSGLGKWTENVTS